MTDTGQGTVMGRGIKRITVVLLICALGFTGLAVGASIDFLGSRKVVAQTMEEAARWNGGYPALWIRLDDAQWDCPQAVRENGSFLVPVGRTRDAAFAVMLDGLADCAQASTAAISGKLSIPDADSKARARLKAYHEGRKLLLINKVDTPAWVGGVSIFFVLFAVASWWMTISSLKPDFKGERPESL
jgi:hypothetical protein